MTCLTLCLALSMMTWLMIFKTAFLTLIVILISTMTSTSPSFNDKCLFLMKFSCQTCYCELEECQHIAEDWICVKGIDPTLEAPSHSLPVLIEQSCNGSEVLESLPPVFVSEGGNCAPQPHNEGDESILLINLQMVHHLTSTYLLFIWMMLLLHLTMLQLMIPTILMKMFLNIFAKASKFGVTNLVV